MQKFNHQFLGKSVRLKVVSKAIRHKIVGCFHPDQPGIHSFLAKKHKKYSPFPTNRPSPEHKTTHFPPIIQIFY